jgi:hypothetical protein
VHSTFWLRFIRVVLGVMLVLDISALLFAVLNPAQTFGTVSSSDIFAGDPYLPGLPGSSTARLVAPFSSAARGVSADVASRVSSAIAAAPHEVGAQLVINCLEWRAGSDQDIDKATRPHTAWLLVDQTQPPTGTATLRQ